MAAGTNPHARITRMMITVAIEPMHVVRTAMQAHVGQKIERSGIIIESRIGVHRINADATHAIVHIERTIEIVPAHETFELAARKHIAQVVVAQIKAFIIPVYSVGITGCQVVHHEADAFEEVIVDFIHIIALHAAESQLIRHAVGHETRILAHFRGAHRSKGGGCPQPEKHQHQAYCLYSFHSHSYFIRSTSVFCLKQSRGSKTKRTQLGRARR